MNIVRIDTGRGVVVSFVHNDTDVPRKKVPVKSSRELIQVMSGLSRSLIENPIDEDIQRTWVTGGEKLYDKPDKKTIVRISEGEEG